MILVISPNRSWCTQRIMALVGWSSSPLPRKDILWLVPSRQTAESLQGQLMEQSTNTAGVFFPNITLLPAWIKDVYQRMGDGKALIENPTREIIIQHLVEKSSYLKDSRHPGIIAKISQFVVQAKRNGLSIEELTGKMRIFNRRRNKREELCEKDKFLLEIMENYQDFLRKKMSIDQEDTVGWLAGSVMKKEAGLMNYLSGYKTIILDGFYYLSRSQMALLRVLVDCFPQTIMSIHAEPSVITAGATDDSHMVADDYMSFIRGAYEKKPRCELQSYSGKTAAVLFDNPTDRVEEVRKIARGIKAILLETREIPPDHIGVVFPSLDVYAPLLHEIFPQYGIPYQLGHRLSCSPAAQIIKKMLDLRCNGFLLDDLEEFFSYGFITPMFTREKRAEFFHSLNLQEPGECGFDFPTFADLCRQANVSGGVDIAGDWLEPIKKYLDAHSESRDSESAANWAKVGNALFYLDQLYSSLWQLPNPLTPVDFQDKILELADFFQITRNFISSLRVITPELFGSNPRNFSKQEVRNLAAFSRIKNILGEINLHLQFLDDTKFPLSTLRKLFLRYMTRSEFSLPIHEKSISIMNLSETGGLTFDTIFMGGMIEGELPQARERDIFYPAGSGKFFDTCDRCAESQFLFRGLLENCRQVFLFTPSASDDKTLFPSSFIDPDWKPLADSDTIYSRQELLEHIGESPNQYDILKEIDPQTSEQTKRMKEIKRLRSSPQLSNYEGVLNNPENLVRLKERFTGDNPYSVSQLDEYARCPMQYFFDRILTLKPIPPVIEEMEADERGRLVHKILEKYYRGTGELSDQEVLRRKLLSSANHIFDKWAPPFHNAFWEGEKRKLLSGLDGGKKPGMLFRFWQNEQQQLKYSHPILLEFSFGEKDDFFYIDDIRLVGRIDRVDRLPDTNSFLFFDYKTGKIPALEDINKGLAFQIPVYLMALTDYSRKKGLEWTTGAGGFYAVNEKDVKIAAFYGNLSVENHLHSNSRKNRFFSNACLNEELQTIKNRIRQIDQDIKDGKFPLPQIDPKDVPCKYCDYKKICRYTNESPGAEP